MGITAVPIAARQRPPDSRAASAAATAIGCVRAAEDAGTYVPAAMSIDRPGSDTLEPEDAARAAYPANGRQTRPGRRESPDAPGPSDDVLSLPLIFDSHVDARRYVGRRVEVKGELERQDGEIDGAGKTRVRVGTAGSTETTGQTGSVSATGQTEQSARGEDRSKMSNTEALFLRVASVRMLSSCGEDGG
ncbi:MAG: hypothetical protein ACRD2X_16460 [Vicinamibacteraceae bacterium]